MFDVRFSAEAETLLSNAFDYLASTLKSPQADSMLADAVDARIGRLEKAPGSLPPCVG